MTTFSEANQAKLSLKMQLHHYAFYDSAAVIIEHNGDFGVMILVRGLNDNIRKIIPTVHMGTSIQVNNAK